MSKTTLLPLTVILLVISAPFTSRSQQRGRRPGPVNRGVVPPKPKEVVPVRTPYNWNPMFTGQVSKLVRGKTDNEVFALTSSSLYRSNNFGKDWTMVFSPSLNLPAPRAMFALPNYNWRLVFEQSKADPQVMYLGTIGHTSNLTTNFYAGSLWKSVNGGKDWQHLNDNSYASGSMPFDPNYRTGQGSVVTSLAISPKNPNTAFMTGIDGRLYKSLNGGTSWTDVTPPDTRPFQIAINPHDVENMYLLDGRQNPLETTDSGSTWHEMKYDLSLLETGFNAFYDKDRRWTWMTFHPNMQGRLLGVVNSHLVVSDDGGKSWRDISFITGTFKYHTNSYKDGERQGYNIAAIQVLNFSNMATDTLYVSANDGVYKSTDLGKAWTLLFKEPTHGFIVSNDEKKILTATELGSFLASEEFTKWTSVGTTLPFPSTEKLTLIDSFESPLYLGKSNKDLIRSSNGVDWEWETNPLMNTQCDKEYRDSFNKPYKVVSNVIQFFKTQDGTSYTVGDCAGSGPRKIVRERTAKSKEEIRTTGSGCDQWHDCRIALSPFDSQKLYLYSDKMLAVSDNGGESWGESINNGVSVAVVSPRNPNTAYAVLAGTSNSLNSVLATTDGGKSWKAGTPSLQDLAITAGMNDRFGSVTVSPDDPNIAFVTNKNAVFRTSDSGQTWTLVTRNQFNGEIYDVTFERSSRETIYLATSNGIWRSNDSGKTWIAFSDGIPIYRIISSKDFTVAIGKGVIYRLGKSANENSANARLGDSPSGAPMETPNRDLPSKKILRSTQGGFTINRECDGGLCHFEIVSFKFGSGLTISVGQGDSSLSYYFSVEITEGNSSKEYVLSGEDNAHFVEKVSRREVDPAFNKLLLDVYTLGKYVVDSNMAIRNRKFSATGQFAALANLSKGLE
jgi:photosystem II stability/assembly factor-like uncharacterized protein